MTELLDNDIKRQVTELFNGLEHPVEILFFGSQDKDSCMYCSDTVQMLGEVSQLSDRISLSEYDLSDDAETAAEFKVDGVPAFVLVGRDGEQRIDYGVRYKGIPAGHEFASLINDLLLVSQRDSNLAPETREFLRELREPVLLQVFVTPSCPYCPRAVVLAHQFALESPLVEAEMIEATEFPELAERFSVSGVPQTTINLGAGSLVGAAPEQNLIAEIRQALKQPVSA